MVRKHVFYGDSNRMGRDVIRQDIDIDGYWKLIVAYNVYLGKQDRGFTHTDFNKRISIIGISDYSSIGELLDTITHEVKHLVSHICKYYNINEDSENASYLTGYVIKNMYKVFKRYLCN